MRFGGVWGASGMSCEGWESFQLKDVVERFIDYRGKTPEKTSTGIPLITAKIVKGGFISEPNEFISSDIYDSWMTRGIPEKGDVLITTEAPLGEVAQINTSKRIALAQRLIAIRGKSNILDNTFLKYNLMTSTMQNRLTEKSSGSTVTGIKSAELKKVRIDLPPLPEQRAIARILSSLDDKIELNNRMNKTLEEMAQTIFKRWFVDFEFPDENGNPYKSSGGKMVESKLGLIPEGWRAGPIQEIVVSYIGGDWGNDEQDYDNSEIVGCIRGADFPTIGSGVINSIPTRFIKKGSLLKRRLEHGDIVLEISGGTKGRPVGRTIYINHSLLEGYEHPIVFSNFCRLVRCKKGFGLMTSLYIQKKYVEGEIEQYQVQSTGIANFQFNDFLQNFQIIIPDNNALNAFNEIVDTLLSKKNTSDSTILTQLRDTLLPKLMSGEICVPVGEVQ
jgi:type I restriction enzyme S subunit